MSSPPTQPREIRSALPEGGRLPRVGKLRLGIKKQSSKGNSMVEYPSAVDYFVVNEDAATSRQAAESFHEVYGDQPRELEVTLPAATLGDVLEGAWRSYGTGGLLKRRCEGPGGNCVVRAKDGGGWQPGPCACQAEGLDPADKRNHCQERFTLTIMLMQVKGVGVWQVDTGSRMAAEGLASSLRMIESFRGHLQGAKASLRVVPRQVSPGGVAKTVWILELGSNDLTPAQALELGASPARVELPPSTLDDEPDELLDYEALLDDSDMEIEVGEAEAVSPPVPSPAPPAGAEGGAAVDGAAPTRILTPVSQQIKALRPMERAELYRLAGIPKGTPSDTVRSLLCVSWDTLDSLPDFGTGEPDVKLLLHALLDHARQLSSLEQMEMQ